MIYLVLICNVYYVYLDVVVTRVFILMFAVNLPHGRPRPIWLVDAQSTVSSITGDQPLKRPPQPRDPTRPDDPATSGDADGSGGSAPSLEAAAGIGGLPETGDLNEVSVGDILEADRGGVGASSTSTTTTLRPPPWLKTNVNKNSTTTTTTSSTTTTTTTTTPEPSTAAAMSGAASVAASSNHSSASVIPPYKKHELPSVLDQENVEAERTLEQDEIAEREGLFDEQDRLLEKELGNGFSSQSYPKEPVSLGRPEDSPVPGWCPSVCIMYDFPL